MFNHDKFSDKREHCKFCENCKECKHHIDNHENCEDYRIFEGIKDSGDCKHYCYRVVGEYKTGFILERSGLFRNHGEHQKPEELDSVFLAVSIFANGEPQELDIGSGIVNHPWIVVNSPETHEKILRLTILGPYKPRWLTRYWYEKSVGTKATSRFHRTASVRCTRC